MNKKGVMVMRKQYRISVRNKSRENQRELMWEVYSSKKAAQEMCDKINAIDAGREAYVVIQ